MATYLSDVAECRTAAAPGAAVAAMCFFERHGGVPESEVVSSSPLILVAVAVEKQERASGCERVVRKAAHYPLSFVVAMEHMVVGKGLNLTAYTQVLAASIRLARIWSATRFDDLLYVKPDGVKMEGMAWSLELTWTKTTGAGKRAQLLYAYVAGGAWVVEPNWLVAGL